MNPTRTAIVAVLLTFVGGVAAPQALASQLAAVTPAGIVTAETTATPPIGAAVPGGWYSVAFSGDRLLATRGDGDACELVDVASGDVLTDTDTIQDRTPDKFRGLCQTSSDSAGSLLFGASAGTAGSSTTYRLNLSTLRVRKVMYGYGGSAADNGSVAAVQHRYFPAPHFGSYELPVLRTSTGRLRPLARVRSPKAGLQYTQVALSRDGRAVAGTRYDPGRQPQQRLLAGSATGLLSRTLWVLPKKQVFFGVAWASDGSQVLVGVARSASASRGTLYAVDPTTGARRELLADVSAFAPAPAS